MNVDRKTIENDESYLRQVSTEVDFKKDDLKAYIKNSKENMANNTISGYDEEIIYINPVIIEANGSTKFLEGCASCIYHKNNKIIHYTGIINRPYLVKIKYLDIKGKEQIKLIEGFETTVFCHEYDHLNGILHMDRTNDIYEMTIEEMKAYRLEHPYTIISKKGEYKYS